MRSRKILRLMSVVLLALLAGCARGRAPAAAGAAEGWRIIEPARISPETAYRHVLSGRAVLVCSYDDDDRCRKLQLDDAMTLSEFESSLMYIPAGKEIIFYCA